MANKKPFAEVKNFNVSASVTRDIKSRIYDIAYKEKTSVSEVVRKLIMKGLSEYERERK